jgi:hypothetical protein
MDEQTATDSPEDRLASFFAPPAAVEKRPVEAQQEEAEPDTEPPAQEAAEVEQDDGEDFDIDGEQYRLPPKLAKQVKEWKEGNLRREDYTAKTQELAHITRTVSAIAEAAQANEAFEKEIAPQREELAAVKQQLKQFKNLNWGEIEFTQHMALRAQMEQLKDRQSDLQNDINTRTDGLKKLRDQKKAEVIREGQKYLSQTIKGWGPKSVEEVTSAARETGYSDEEIGSILDPRFVRLAWEASQYRKAQANKPNALAAAQKAPPVVRPGAVTSNTAQTRIKALAQQHKKSGSVQSAAALFRQMFKE